MKKNWPRVPLREVLKPISRPEAVDPARTYSILGAHWYAQGLYTKDVLTGAGIQAGSVYRVERGDFVYNRLFGWKGSFAIATEGNHGCYVSNEFPCFIVDTDRADGRFLWKYFSLASVWDDVLALSTGGTPTSRNRLKEEQLLTMEVPLPPIEEQRRIVSRIEELAAKIEEAHGLRTHAAEELEALLSAFSNRLFARHDRFPSDRLEEFVTRTTKGESPAWQGFSYQDSGPLFVRSENVLWGVMDRSKRVCIPTEFHQKLNRSQLKPADVLINLVGASIGRACVVPDDIGEANVNQAVAVITPDHTRIDSTYLMHFLISPTTQDTIHGGKVETARPNISLGDLRNLIIPVPSLAEQRRIVGEVTGFEEALGKIRGSQRETAGELDALMPSILSRAFSGEL